MLFYLAAILTLILHAAVHVHHVRVSMPLPLPAFGKRYSFSTSLHRSRSTFTSKRLRCPPSTTHTPTQHIMYVFSQLS